MSCSDRHVASCQAPFSTCGLGRSGRGRRRRRHRGLGRCHRPARGGGLEGDSGPHDRLCKPTHSSAQTRCTPRSTALLLPGHAPSAFLATGAAGLATALGAVNITATASVVRQLANQRLHVAPCKCALTLRLLLDSLGRHRGRRGSRRHGRLEQKRADGALLTRGRGVEERLLGRRRSGHLGLVEQRQRLAGGLLLLLRSSEAEAEEPASGLGGCRQAN